MSRRLKLKSLIALSPLVAFGCTVDTGSTGDEAESLGSSSQALAYSCGTNANYDMSAKFTTWKSRYVTSAGAPGGCLRVQRPQNSGDTVSEGIGYGMLLAAYLNDKTTFDGLWCYYQAHLDNNGLMIWQVNSGGGNMAGSNSAATDADLDAAMALVAANYRWGGYATAASNLIGKIKAFEKHPYGNYLKPGDGWGDIPAAVNPSYFSPAYYRVFASFTGDTWWNSVVDGEYGILSGIDARSSGANSTGLVPDWATNTGAAQYISWDGAHYDSYYYDACRAPWRLATDYAWNCESRANSRLGKMNAFFSGKGANIKDGYNLDGSENSNGGVNGAFVGPAAAAAVQSSSWFGTVWNQAVNMDDNDYFKDSVRMMSMLLASGKMPHPSTLAGGGGGGGGGGSNVGYFRIINQSSGKCLDVAGGPGATGDGPAITQYTCLGDAQTNQHFSFEPTDSGFFKIRARHSGKVVDIDGGPGCTGNGCLIHQWTDLGATNQQWQLNLQAGGWYKLIPRNSTGRVIDVNSCSAADGVQMQIWDSYNNNCQRFRIEPVGWNYVIGKSGGRCLDIDGFSTADGAKVHSWDCGNKQTNQEWKFTNVAGTGYSFLTVRVSNKLLNVPNGAATEDLLLNQWTSNSSTAQQWVMDMDWGNNGGPYFRMRSIASNKALDNSCATGNGVQLKQHTDVAGQCQLFKTQFAE